MKRKILFLGLVACLTTVLSCKENKPQQKPINASSKPNIIYILADDLGYGDLGAYGQEKIETPNIDALAKEGMLFTQHYSSAPVCAPARYMLMTGTHSGHAYIRGNDEWGDRGDVWDYRKMIGDSTLEGQRPVPDSITFFPKRLQEAGYATGMIGKWGLGAPHTTSIPTKKGFDFFVGYNCQRLAHTYYPVHLYKNGKRIYLENDTVAPNTKLQKDADPNDSKSYANFTLRDYAPDIMFTEMLNWVKDQKKTPFFLYWASPIPHMPLQAPKRWVDYYIKKFGPEEPYLGQNGYFPNQNPRAAYAGMISYLDEKIGELVAYLKETEQYDNTLIVFTSDNGVTYNGGVDGAFFNSSAQFDEAYGRGKGFVYEGGIRVPMIATWPGHIKSGSRSDLISAQYDVMATLSDLVGFDIPKNDGISFLPTLLDDGREQAKHDFLYWEFPETGGQVAIRIGDWKVIRQHLKDKEQPTLELYNLTTDPGEKTNVAEAHPEIIQKATDIFANEHRSAENERFRIPLIENGSLVGPKE